MSYSIDTNILLYSVDESNRFHSQAKTFLINRIAADDTMYLCWDVVYAFLRISTHPGIFATPLKPETAANNMQQIVQHPHVSMLGPTDESLNIFIRLQQEMHIRGNLVPDAVIASILEVNGIQTIYTLDRDFWKFRALRPENPFESPNPR